MNFVLDASALLTLVFKEVGEEKVLIAIEQGAILNPVNFSEVISIAQRRGVPALEAKNAIFNLPLQFIDFDLDLAFETGQLISIGKPLGLSLGDRACLATAKKFNAKALTTDRAWAKLSSSFNIQFVR